MRSTVADSFDDLVGQGKERGRDREPERLRGLEIDHEFERTWLLDGKLTGWCSAKNTADKICGSTTQGAVVGAVPQQAPLAGHFGPVTYDGNARLHREIGQLPGVVCKFYVGGHSQCFAAGFAHAGEGFHIFARVVGMEYARLEREPLGHTLHLVDLVEASRRAWCQDRQTTRRGQQLPQERYALRAEFRCHED